MLKLRMTSFAISSSANRQTSQARHEVGGGMWALGVVGVVVCLVCRRRLDSCIDTLTAWWSKMSDKLTAARCKLLIKHSRCPRCRRSMRCCSCNKRLTCCTAAYTQRARLSRAREGRTGQGMCCATFATQKANTQNINERKMPAKL